MKVAAWMIITALLLGVLGCLSQDYGDAAAYEARRKVPFGVGEDFPDLVFDYRPSADEAQYLGLAGKGLAGKGEFSIAQISGDLILLEVISVHCASCRNQAPIMYELYEELIDDPALKDRIKLIALAGGNKPWEVEEYRDEFDVPFPIIPDPKFVVLDQIGVNRTPFHYLLRKSGGEVIVAETHQGIIEDSITYAEDLSYILTFKIAALKQLKGQQTEEPVEPPVPDIAGEELVALIKDGMQEASGTVNGFEMLTLADETVVYMGTTEASGSAAKIFAKLVSRQSICDVCEDLHFVFMFDDDGQVVNLVPIQLTKYRNVLWDEDDLETMRSRVIGKYIYKEFDFDAKVDAVSTATITSVLIFAALERSDGLYRELKQKGYLN